MTEPIEKEQDLSEKKTQVSQQPSQDRKYAILMETSGEECESWYYFIKYQGNEDALNHLQNQLKKIDMYIEDDLSTFDLELDYLVSETTAKEMTKVDLNKESFHRKFDGTLKMIDLGIKDKYRNDKKLRKIYKVLGYGKIDEYIDQEDIDPEDLCSRSSSSSSSRSSDSENSNDSDGSDGSDGSEESESSGSESEKSESSSSHSPPKKPRGKPAVEIPIPRFAKAKKKHK